MDFFGNKFLVLAITFAAFMVGKIIQNRTKSVVLNPILIAIILIICYLEIADVSYATYSEGGDLIAFWLKPAVVALGVPLYMQLQTIKKQIVPIMVSTFVGCFVGIASAVLTAKMLGASDEIALSLAPKSVTTPIAMEVSESIGGIPSLTAAVVVIVGIFGAIFGFKILEIGKIKNPISQGLSMGTASHAVGTSKAMEVSPHYGAFSSLGLILNGIMTAILAPIVLKLMGML